MRNKIIGEYGIIESLISVVMFYIFVRFNWFYLKALFSVREVTQHILFAVVFFDVVCLAIVSLPMLTKISENVANENVRTFLELPERDSKFTFSIISEFLGNQALASFLATVLIFTGKSAIEEYGGVVAAVYMAVLFIFAITIGVLSLIRFIAHFSKYHGFFYALASVLSTGVMFAFFHVGLKLAQ